MESPEKEDLTGLKYYKVTNGVPCVDALFQEIQIFKEGKFCQVDGVRFNTKNWTSAKDVRLLSVWLGKCAKAMESITAPPEGGSDGN